MFCQVVVKYVFADGQKRSSPSTPALLDRSPADADPDTPSALTGSFIIWACCFVQFTHLICGALIFCLLLKKPCGANLLVSEQHLFVQQSLISSRRAFRFHAVYLLPGAEDKINGQEEGSGGGVFMNSDAFPGRPGKELNQSLRPASVSR